MVGRNFSLERYPNQWVAIDLATDEVVLVAETAQRLEDEIAAQGLHNVVVMRAPADDEPLFVGPG